jgi:hypothetical protein
LEEKEKERKVKISIIGAKRETERFRWLISEGVVFVSLYIRLLFLWFDEWMRTIKGRVVFLCGYFSNFSMINQIDTWCEWIGWELRMKRKEVREKYPRIKEIFYSFCFFWDIFYFFIIQK